MPCLCGPGVGPRWPYGSSPDSAAAAPATTIHTKAQAPTYHTAHTAPHPPDGRHVVAGGRGHQVVGVRGGAVELNAVLGRHALDAQAQQAQLLWVARGGGNSL